jgi:hypothetical protein
MVALQVVISSYLSIFLPSLFNLLLKRFSLSILSFRGEGLDHVDVHSHSGLKGEGHRAEVKAESFSPAPEMQQFLAQKIETYPGANFRLHIVKSIHDIGN